MPGKPRLQAAQIIEENNDNYNIQIIFDNGHKANLKVLKDENTRYTARDSISEMYIFRNLFGLHHFQRESEEEKAHVRKIIDNAILAHEKE